MTWVWRHRGIFTSQPVARLTGIVHGNAPGEATKKQLVFGRLMSLSATCSQESAMATTGEWIDNLFCVKLTLALLNHAVRF